MGGLRGRGWIKATVNVTLTTEGYSKNKVSWERKYLKAVIFRRMSRL